MTESATPKIESQDLSVGELFKDFYSVPDFQREYVWQREQVEKLLQASTTSSMTRKAASCRAPSTSSEA